MMSLQIRMPPRRRSLSIHTCRCWEVFYRIRLYGDDAKTVADRMGISVQRVYQLADRVTEIAKKYRRENR